MLTSSAALLMLVATACMDSGPGKVQREISPAYIKKNLLAELPEFMPNIINANLGGKVVYLGNEVEDDSITAGDKVRVVHYWQVIEPPGKEWRVFSHLDGTTPKDWANVDDTDMRYGYGPGKWKAGDIIRDEQEFRISKDWTSSVARLSVGLFRRGGKTSADRMPITSGPSDKESRIPVATIHMVGTVTKLPGYVVRRASGPITIDGRANEESWKNAPSSPVFASAEGGPEVQGITKARLLWDDEYLYVYVDAEDSDVSSQYKNHDDPLWKEDVVEIFIDADRSRSGYIELQVNPNNAQFDAWIATNRGAGTDQEWSANMKSAVTVRGTLNQPGDQDQGWEAEIAIPMAAVKGKNERMRVVLPPPISNIWRMNVVRIDKPRDQNLSVSSWSKITYQDFHALDRMFEAVFGDEEGSIKQDVPEYDEDELIMPEQPGDRSGKTAAPGSAGGKASAPAPAKAQPAPSTTPAKAQPAPSATPAKAQPAPSATPAPAKPARNPFAVGETVPGATPKPATGQPAPATPGVPPPRDQAR